jgi:flagellar biogenesis protein FliO
VLGLNVLRLLLSACGNFFSGVRSIRYKRKQRSMRLCETLPLGDRRYLALVEVDGHRFLLGAAGNSVSLLARLCMSPEAAEAIPKPEPDAFFDVEEYKTWR